MAAFCTRHNTDVTNKQSQNSLGLWISLRLLLRGGRGFSRFVSWVSVIGLTLGVMALTAVVAVMNGFDHELKHRLLGSVPHITLTNARPSESLRHYAEDSRVRHVAAYFQSFGVLNHRRRVQPVMALALNEAGFEAQTELLETLSEGAMARLMSDGNGVIVGRPLARSLGLLEGDNLNLMLAVPRGESLGSSLLRLRVAGTFEIGADPDYSLLLLNLAGKSTEQWRQLGQTGMRLQLHDALDAAAIVDALEDAKLTSEDESAVVVTSWIDEYGGLFQAVAMEKTMMATLLLLVVAIAGFNIVAGQIMMVNDKRSDIAILRTMGADQSLIRNIFLVQGLLVGLLGTVIGLGAGVLIASKVNEIVDGLEWLTGRHLLDGSYFVEVPSRVEAFDLIVTAAVAGALAVWAAWLPARRASEVDPVENLQT